MRPEWTDFVGGKWEKEINVRDFIQKNYTAYTGDAEFLAGPTQRTQDMMKKSMSESKIYAVVLRQCVEEHLQ